MNAFMEAVSGIDIAYVLALIAGTVAGYVIGALPGFSATMGVALFVPFSYKMGTNVAFAFLIALYCSAVFAGSIPAILIRTPGTPAAICTIFDGYPMAQKGQAGRALGYACFASVFGGVFSAIVLVFVAELVARFALLFGAQEYFALAILGISMVVGMSGDNLIKGFIATALGLMVTVVGMDSMSGWRRFTFGRVELLSGIQQLPVLIGLFAITEVFCGFSEERQQTLPKQDVSHLGSALKDMFKHWKLLLQSSVVGTFLGALPGVGATTAAIMGYDAARRSSKTPEKMGTGLPEGIIGPECANNAVTGGAIIPMLALGIPGDPVTAILLGALMIQGLQPGPELFTKHPQVVMSIYISVILSYVAILIFSAFSIKYIAKLLNIRTGILSAFVLVFCVVGVYAMQNSYFDVFVAIFFGVIGYFLRKYDYPLGPFTLALVLGKMLDTKLQLALKLTHNNPLTFFTRPISGTLMAITAIFIAVSIIRIRKKNKKAEAAK